MPRTLDTIKAGTIEETFANAEPLLTLYATKFWSRYGGDLDEYLSEALYQFTLTYYNWPYEKCNYKTYLSNVLNYSMRNIKRRRNKKHLDKFTNLGALTNEEEIDFDVPQLQHNKSVIVDILDELSTEAKTAISCLHAISWDDNNKSASWCSLRNELKKFLAEELGWSKHEIKRTFKEIADVLCD